MAGDDWVKSSPFSLFLSPPRFGFKFSNELSVGGLGFINYKVGYKMPGKGGTRPASEATAHFPPAGSETSCKRTGFRWLGEGQDWPQPRARVREGGGGGEGMDASARGLSPGQSLWAASDWPCPAPLSPGTPQGGDLPYQGPAADRIGGVTLASLWL